MNVCRKAVVSRPRRTKHGADDRAMTLEEVGQRLVLSEFAVAWARVWINQLGVEGARTHGRL
jgi:hypothetical protein